MSNVPVVIMDTPCKCGKPHIAIHSTEPKWLVDSLYRGYIEEGYHPYFKNIENDFIVDDPFGKDYTKLINGLKKLSKKFLKK